MVVLRWRFYNLHSPTHPNQSSDNAHYKRDDMDCLAKWLGFYIADNLTVSSFTLSNSISWLILARVHFVSINPFCLVAILMCIHIYRQSKIQTLNEFFCLNFPICVTFNAFFRWFFVLDCNKFPKRGLGSKMKEI